MIEISAITAVKATESCRCPAVVTRAIGRHCESVIGGNLAWETEVVGTHHALARTPAAEAYGEVSPAWLAAHERFYLAVLSGCHNSYLVSTAVRLRAIATRRQR